MITARPVVMVMTIIIGRAVVATTITDLAVAVMMMITGHVLLVIRIVIVIPRATATTMAFRIIATARRMVIAPRHGRTVTRIVCLTAITTASRIIGIASTTVTRIV